MAGLEESVGLDIGPALASLDDLAQSATETLGGALTQIVSDFSSQLQGAIEDLSSVAAAVPDVTIPVDADTSLADAEIAGVATTAEATVGTVTVDADVSSAESAVADAIATIDGEEATFSVDADTSPAEDSIGGLTDSVKGLGGAASSSGSALHGFSGETSILSGAALLAEGHVAGVREGLGAIPPQALAATGGVLALAGGLYGLAQAGIEATSAEQRFTFVLGDQAKAVQAVNVGNLRTDLATLAKELGTTDTAMRNSVATIFQFASNAGASGVEAKNFSQELFALASRAAALRPSLGDVADVATRMEVGLGRARSAAQQFGISISQAEINTRALSDTGKASAAELTAYEKSVAGAEIALLRYGATLKQTVEEGSKNAAIQQRQVTAEIKNTIEAAGKQLVVPFLELMRAGVPIVKDFASALATVAGVLGPLAGFIQLIEPAIKPAILGFIAFEIVSRALPALLALTAGGVEVLAGTFPILGAAAETAAGEIAGAAITVESAAGPIGLIVAGLSLAAAALGIFGGSASNAKEDIKSLTDEMQHTDTLHLAALFDETAKKAMALGFSVGQVAAINLVRFREVAETNLGVAQRLIDSYTAQGRSVTGYQHQLDLAIKSQQAQDVATGESARALDAANVKVGAQAQLVNAARLSLDAYAHGTGSATQALKDYTAQQQNASDALSLYTTELNAVISPQLNFVQTNIAFADSLRKVADALGEQIDPSHTAAQVESDHKTAIIGSVQALIAYAGATAAKEIAEGRASTAQETANNILAQGTTQLEGQLIALGQTKDAADAFLRTLGLFPGDAAAAAAAISGTLTPAIKALGTTSYADGYDAGRQLAAGFGTGMLNNRELADNAAAQLAEGAILAARAALDAASPSQRAARDVGEPFTAGVALGITSTKDAISRAATDAVDLRGLSLALPEIAKATAARSTGSLAVLDPSRSFGSVFGPAPANGPITYDHSTRVEKVEVSARNDHPIEMAYGLAKELDVQMHLLGR